MRHSGLVPRLVLIALATMCLDCATTAAPVTIIDDPPPSLAQQDTPVAAEARKYCTEHPDSHIMLNNPAQRPWLYLMVPCSVFTEAPPGGIGDAIDEFQLTCELFEHRRCEGVGV